MKRNLWIVLLLGLNSVVLGCLPAKFIREDSSVVSPRMDTQFVYLALEFLETGDRELLPRIAETCAARHLAAHAQRVSMAGSGPNAEELIEQVLTSASMADVDPEEIRAKLSLMETDRNAQLRCWNEAAAYLPRGALSEAVLFLTVGYDIGVAVSGQASLNLAHPHFAEKPEEIWFYCVHELHHAGFQKYNDMPALADIRTTRELADLIRYLTTMEGLAVHAARRWRTESGALESDSDYVALLDPERMDVYEKEFFRLYRSLAEVRPRPVEKGDWEILGRMSTVDRLWYRVGARMANRIQKELRRDVLIETIVEGPAAFFGLYAELTSKKSYDRGGP